MGLQREAALNVRLTFTQKVLELNVSQSARYGTIDRSVIK